MNKKGARVNVPKGVEFTNLKGRGPKLVACQADWKGGRPEREYVENQSLVVATVPSVGQKSAFRVPPMANRLLSVERPLPVDSLVERIGQSPDFSFAHMIAIEI